MVFIVSILHRLTRKIFKIEVSGEFEEQVEDALAWRLKTVTRSISKWREIPSISFALAIFVLASSITIFSMQVSARKSLLGLHGFR